MAGDFVRPTIQEGRGYSLADYPTRPIDEATGLPYCFIPNPDLPPVSWPEPNVERQADWDHQYPRAETKYGANPVLQEAHANLALMNLRIQWTNYREHHDIWNKAPYIGPLQPATKKQLAATLLFGLSGYVPPVGINLSSGKPIEQRLSDDERLKLWQTKQVRVGCESPVLACLRSYVLLQEVDHINESELDEFLHTFDPERRLYLGHCLAAKVIERAVEPFDATYVRVHKQGLLSVRDEAQGMLRPAPANPRDLLKTKLTRGKRFGPVMDALAHRLAQHQKGESQDIAS